MNVRLNSSSILRRKPAPAELKMIQKTKIKTKIASQAKLEKVREINHRKKSNKPALKPPEIQINQVFETKVVVCQEIFEPRP